MSIMSGRLVLPLIMTTLSNRRSLVLSPAIRIERLDASILDKLRGDAALSSGFSRAVSTLEIGLVLEPSKVDGGNDENLGENIRTAQFITRCLQLATDVPLDAPWWFDAARGGEVFGFGRVTARVFRSGPRYVYPLDEGQQTLGLKAIKPHLTRLIASYANDLTTDRVGRALEFAMVGFQTWHLPTRLVNQVTYMESLFSTGTTELAHQCASRIAWYLSPLRDSGAREQMFDRVKDIYNARSTIVHGGASRKLTARRMRLLLTMAEMTNSAIFRRLLSCDHFDAFSNADRDQELKRLGLGIRSVFR